MKIPAIDMIQSKEEARDFVIEWQIWQSEHPMYMSELIDWTEYFEALGRKFNLTEEFKENGII